MDESKPVVAILGGTGREGSGLAMRWAVAGYPIIIGSRQKEKAEAAAAKMNQKLGIDSIKGLENFEAVRAADICVLTVVAKAHEAAVTDLKEVLQGKILVDTTARLSFPDLRPPSPPAAAEIAQEILGPDVRVVAAFQNAPAHLLKKLNETISSDILVCANDKDAADRVIRLADHAGMRAFYAGKLANAITVEGLTSVLIYLNDQYKVGNASIVITGI